MDFDRIPLLGVERTPLLYLANLSKYLGGPEIYMKREDMNGCIGLAGNKLRKLEYLLADAVNKKCDVVVTTGGLQSNHCRATAAAARRVGLKPVLVLIGEPEEPLKGNLLLDNLMGAEFVFGNDYDLMDQLLEETVENLKKKGHSPYVIPLGASNGLGTIGFISAAKEMSVQLEENNVQPTWQVVTTGSAGTYTGVLLGSSIPDTLGISVVASTSEIKDRIKSLAVETCQLTGVELDISDFEKKIKVDDTYLGEGYGIATDEGVKAIKLLAEKEGILLDPTYTSKAMAGLIDYIKRGIINAGDKVVFWHTGGQIGLFTSSLPGQRLNT